MIQRRSRRLALAVLCAALTGCGTTLDSLGSDDSSGGAPAALAPLSPLTGPASYPNTFRDLLGKSDSAIADKLEAAFSALFHGDPTTQAIYFPVGSDGAYIQDVLHGDVRSEGIGIAMIVCVELDKRSEFDRLWSYAVANLEEQTGDARGYFDSVCDDSTPCLDPYGMEQFATALLFAKGRWGGNSYESDAQQLLGLLRKREPQREIIAVFDETTHLVREEPRLSAAGYTRTALQIPAMYELWAQASGDSFWSEAANAARAHLLLAANAQTGLWPTRSYFDAAPVAGFDTFTPQGYRAQLNIALDAVLADESDDRTALANRVLGFFSSQGTQGYGTSFSLDGKTLDTNHEQGLVAVNGALAVAATRSERSGFVNAVWNMAIPSGDVRYYDGALYLLSLLVLSGQYRVY